MKAETPPPLATDRIVRRSRPSRGKADPTPSPDAPYPARALKSKSLKWFYKRGPYPTYRLRPTSPPAKACKRWGVVADDIAATAVTGSRVIEAAQNVAPVQRADALPCFIYEEERTRVVRRTLAIIEVSGHWSCRRRRASDRLPSNPVRQSPCRRCCSSSTSCFYEPEWSCLGSSLSHSDYPGSIRSSCRPTRRSQACTSRPIWRDLRFADEPKRDCSTGSYRCRRSILHRRRTRRGSR